MLTDHELQTLCVPLDECILVKTGKVDPGVLAELEKHGYDQAPVYDAGGRVLYGLISTERLRTLQTSGGEISEGDIDVRDEGHFLYTGSFLTVDRLLTALSDRRAVFVVRESSATEYGYNQSIYGLLTVSDLNRHALRGALYTVLSELESGLASVIDSHFLEPWHWIQILGENHQVSVLGYWELSKKRGVDVGPIAATTLAQLLNVVARTKGLLQELGYRSRNEFEDNLGYVPELRNCVMHPVRPLVLSASDVTNVRNTVVAVMDLYRKVEAIRTKKIG